MDYLQPNFGVTLLTRLSLHQTAIFDFLVARGVIPPTQLPIDRAKLIAICLFADTYFQQF